MKKQDYERPTCFVLTLEAQDVVTTSANGRFTDGLGVMWDEEWGK